VLVVPQFEPVFRDLGGKLNAGATLVLAASAALRANLNLVLGLSLGLALLSWLALRDRGRRVRVVAALTSIPGVAGPMRDRRTARIVGVLALLLDNGVSLPTTLRILRDIVPDPRCVSAIDRLHEEVRNGRRFADALAGTDLLPPLAIRMLRVGDETALHRGPRGAVLRAQVRDGPRPPHGRDRTDHDRPRQPHRRGAHRVDHERSLEHHGACPVTAVLRIHGRRRARARAGEAGFTLVELLVVLTIISLILGLVGPRVLGYLGESRVKAAKLQIENFGSALDLFSVDAGRYPTTSEGLEALVQRPPTVQAWNGPYLKGAKVPLDPWGNAYQYRAPVERINYEIVSLGSDGREGGTGIAADISNAER
jgi:general secretion pathway protein G